MNEMVKTLHEISMPFIYEDAQGGCIVADSKGWCGISSWINREYLIAHYVLMDKEEMEVQISLGALPHIYDLFLPPVRVWVKRNKF